MTASIVDTNVLIEVLRKSPKAAAWIAAQKQPVCVTPITWLDVVYGARGRSGLAAARKLLGQFAIIYLTQTDQDWAMQQLFTYRLSRGVEINDCLIASVCYRLQNPIYTHNVKDMRKVLPAVLVINPYEL